jgi:micrococcal nuclease
VDPQTKRKLLSGRKSLGKPKNPSTDTTGPKRTITDKDDNMNLYTYIATVNRVVDGDTIDLILDLGFRMSWKANCRFAGVNAPELSSTITEVKEAAYKAKSYVESKIKPGDKILLKSHKLDKYGRPVAKIYYGKDYVNCINDELLKEGLAISYMAD